MEFEEGEKHLQSLLVWYNEKKDDGRNEAATRFHLIDEIFFNCLGWDKDFYRPEESHAGKFADYTFLNPNRCLIVEAKKEGIYFELPVTQGKKKLEYKINTLLKYNDNIKKAIEQVLAYCNERGVEYAVVSNGHQIIAFLASRNDGVSPLEGKALVFESLEDMSDNFLTLWQNLSPIGVKEKRLTSLLRDNSIIVLPPKLSSKIQGYPGNKIRNTLQVDLQIVSEVVLEDVMKSEEIEIDFVKETYCSSGALSQYALVSKTILETRYALLFSEDQTNIPAVKDAVTKKGVSKEIFAESLSSRPILLIGDVGTGKSMFIKYLRVVEGKDVFDKSITLYIDLGSKAALESNLKVFVLNEIESILMEKYSIDINERNFVRGVYHSELAKFAKGIYGDLKESNPIEYQKQEIEFLKQKLDIKYEHIKHCFNSITRSWKKQIVLFIDNVDQREDEVQESAFLIANEIAANWPSTVFLTIRPSTFHMSKKVGALTGYHPKAFTIAPPRVDDVVIKRLNFAAKISSGEIQSSQLPASLNINLKTLTQFIEILQFSFTYNRDLKECLDNMCYGNIRLAIELLTIFISSAHIDTKKILEIDSENAELGQNRYMVSVHEFLRAIIFRENTYYNPRSSLVMNLFDVSQFDGKEHFLAPIFLDYFERQGSLSTKDGFVETANIMDYLQNLGFNYKQIEFCLIRCLDKELIEIEGRGKIVIDNPLPNAMRITTKGAYHMKKLINYFTYVDAVITDIPILDNEVRAEIETTLDIEKRINRVLILCGYLDKQWLKIRQENQGFDWTIISKAIKQNANDALNNYKAKSAKGKKS